MLLPENSIYAFCNPHTARSMCSHAQNSCEVIISITEDENGHVTSTQLTSWLLSSTMEPKMASSLGAKTWHEESIITVTICCVYYRLL